MLHADPFRPFEIYLQGSGQDYRIDDPGDIAFKGDVLVIRYDYKNGRREDWVPLAAIAVITVFDPIG